MSACSDREQALNAYLDAELESPLSAELEAHLASCPDCRAELQVLTAVSDAVRRAGPLALSHPAAGRQSPKTEPHDGDDLAGGAFPAPAAPRSSGAGVQHANRFRGLRALSAAATVVLALAVGYGIGRNGGMTAARSAAVETGLADDLLSAHLRALQPGRLVDVESSDRHQVKPWFAGRLDFAPPVPDLAAQGFPLLGGRVDFVAGHRAAVMVYARRLHRIDVFAFPSSADAALPVSTRLGFNLVSWREPPLTLIAVSDLDPTELRTLATLHAAAR